MKACYIGIRKDKFRLDISWNIMNFMTYIPKETYWSVKSCILVKKFSKHVKDTKILTANNFCSEAVSCPIPKVIMTEGSFWNRLNVWRYWIENHIQRSNMPLRLVTVRIILDVKKRFQKIFAFINGYLYPPPELNCTFQ